MQCVFYMALAYNTNYTYDHLCTQMQQQGHVPEHHAMHSSQEMSAFKDKHSQQQLHKDGAQGHGVVEDGEHCAAFCFSFLAFSLSK